MNRFMNSLTLPDENPFYVFRKTTDIVHPRVSQAWVFIDTHEDSVHSGLFQVSMWDPNSPWHPHYWASLAGSRHNGAATISFADGHVEIKKWLDARTRAPVKREWHVPVIEENPDAAWLQERTTSLKNP